MPYLGIPGDSDLVVKERFIVVDTVQSATYLISSTDYQQHILKVQNSCQFTITFNNKPSIDCFVQFILDGDHIIEFGDSNQEIIWNTEEPVLEEGITVIKFSQNSSGGIIAELVGVENQ